MKTWRHALRAFVKTYTACTRTDDEKTSPSYRVNEVNVSPSEQSERLDV